MVDLVASLLEELPLVVGGGEVAGVPPTLRYQRHRHITSLHQRHIKRLQCGEKRHQNLLLSVVNATRASPKVVGYRDHNE